MAISRIGAGSARSLLSLFFLGVLAVKVLEGGLGLESWPFTNVSMFYERRPPEQLPVRPRLFGTRADGGRVEIAAEDVWLSADEFNRKLLDDPDPQGACGDLARSYNRRRGRGAARLTAAEGVWEEIARPGLERETFRISFECALDPARPRDPTLRR